MKRQCIDLPRGRAALRTFVALVAAFCVWAPNLHRLFVRPVSAYRPAAGFSNSAHQLADAQIQIWTDPSLRTTKLRELRATNPEWDFMSRTYLVLSLANMALRQPSYRGTACKVMDTVIQDTLRHEREAGFKYFLLSYGHGGGWMASRPRSIFIDGEIALMLACRRMVEEKPDYKPALHGRVRAMIAQMSESPVLCAESYPNECWMFCNMIALASMRMADVLDSTDHSAFISRWLSIARHRLIDRKTGILISAFSVDGSPAACGSGAEGSTIWMACNMLQIVNPEFAHRQYRLAKTALSDHVLGFGYAREWPRGSGNSLDIDSGPIAPLLSISPSSTALAAVAAAAFGDDTYFRDILAAIGFGGLPIRHDGKLRYGASNQVGDAVLLYALTEGPLWSAVRGRIHKW